MDIRKEIKKLSTEEQILLIQDIWDNLETETKSALTREKKLFLDNQLDVLAQGKGTTVTMEQIKLEFDRLKRSK